MTRLRLVSACPLFAIVCLAACRAAPGTGSTPADGAASAASLANAAQGAAAAAVPAAGAAAPPSGVALNSGAFSGAVTETMNSGGYTYMKVRGGKDGKEEVWVAAPEFGVKPGAPVTVSLDMAMEHFHSKTLDRDFPVLYFVSKVAREGETLVGGRGPVAGPAAPIDMMRSHQSAAATAAPLESIPPASGGLKIADVLAQRKTLAGRAVVVRGKVVKVNNGIMDRNWIHLQDGSGAAGDRTDDLTITTAAALKLGDIVTLSGVLAIARDFGAGYAYDAILENAKVTGK